ncbi:DUF411 domain-containing protein [Rhizobium laguerreae]|uniref:DUF411 domain-containing protein n=1 Tax=Rhizobium laguerreae TaxID=1076926 RepID=UPI001C91207A|nr:DUF411 domain-containing protein [Rhizobium laguerreae]MBY3377532.1 DUF411 domain-containing protein [Rhizobium laguerreae]
MNRRAFISGAATCVAVTMSSTAKAATGVTVYKDPNCGCCHAWADALTKAGFSVTVEDATDLSAIKARYNVPDAVQGCHTGVVEGKYLEGHIPLEAIHRMLREKPDIAGLAVPGMPSGSLGMGNDPQASYDVFAVPKGAGTPQIYQSVRPK